MLKKIGLKQYLLVSFAVAAFALLGEALCTLRHTGSVRAYEGTATNALLIAPSRTTSAHRPTRSR